MYVHCHTVVDHHNQNSITDCGINIECCRLNDEYTCNANDNLSNNIYERSFTIPMNNNINENDNNNVYFRLYSDHMYIEYKYRNTNAIGIPWSDYNHPLHDKHFTIFASDINNNNQCEMLIC